ncbi:hypothetical protein [Caenispirillum salinarum]|uniref:hypothetical protein n=1 Tax=Caenispirillum salinarum TaxID=859058 RepID=UPI00384C41AF
MTVLRNICAHHGRLWNRHFSVAPTTYQPLSMFFLDNNTFYTQAMVLKLLLDRIAPDHRWHERLDDLLTAHPNVPAEKMGFPKRWRHLKPWH